MIKTLLLPILFYTQDIQEIRYVLKHLESNYQQTAVGDSGSSIGVLQIKKIVIKDVNRIYKTNYKHTDCFREDVSNEIFDLYIKHGIKLFKQKHNKEPTEEDIVRMWNGGIYNGYKYTSTIKYYKKYLAVKNRINKFGK